MSRTMPKVRFLLFFALIPIFEIAAQSNQNAVFVANDGNLEGSITAFVVNPDSTLTMSDRLVTGVDPDPATNAHTISLTPNGRFLAVGHATAANDFEQLTIIRVNSDATLTEFASFQVPDSPFVVQWIDDALLAVTKTDVGGTNEVQIYRFDPGSDRGAPTLTFIDSEVSGDFTTSLALHANGQYLFAQSSFSNLSITAFEVTGSGDIQFIQNVSTSPTFPLGMGIDPNGKHIYACSGTSSGRNTILGYSIGGDGMLQAHAQTYTTPGNSPAQITISSDGAYAYVGHGTDATIRAFSVDNGTGALTSTGFMFDVGFQGSLGGIEALGDLLFALDKDTVGDGVKGIYSFTVNGDGSLTQNGALLDTDGSRPTEMAVWASVAPPCPADLSGNGTVGPEDLQIAIENWGGSLGDVNGDGSVDLLDLTSLLNQYGPCS